MLICKREDVILLPLLMLTMLLLVHSQSCRILILVIFSTLVTYCKIKPQYPDGHYLSMKSIMFIDLQLTIAPRVVPLSALCPLFHWLDLQIDAFFQWSTHILMAHLGFLNVGCVEGQDCIFGGIEDWCSQTFS